MIRPRHRIEKPIQPPDDPASVGVGKSERLLAWILAGFILLALSWAYVNIDDGVRNAYQGKRDSLQGQLRQLESARIARQRELELVSKSTAGPTGPSGMPVPPRGSGYGTGAYTGRLDRGGGDGRLSENALWEAKQRVEALRGRRDTARERYRTELDAGVKNAKLEHAYRDADQRATAAEASLGKLKRDQSAASVKLKQFDRSQFGERRRIEDRMQANQRVESGLIFLLRALLAFGTLALSLALIRKVAERSPRTLPLAQAAVGASALLAMSMIVDYSEVSFDFESLGPLGLSALGCILTIAGFFALQRYLRKRRPVRRLRSGECRTCGYPAGQSVFCESCGEQLLETCASCGQSRRIGVAHCRVCGVS